MEKDECSRVEWLAQFDDYALASMASGGYRLEDDTLETCTAEELEAVRLYRLESFNKWAATNPFVELETMLQGETITELVYRVYGGNSPFERLEVAQEYSSYLESEGYVISCDRYETASKKDGEGRTYTEFRFTCS